MAGVEVNKSTCVDKCQLSTTSKCVWVRSMEKKPVKIPRETETHVNQRRHKNNNLNVDTNKSNGQKRARIVVRNISFKTTEQGLKEHFAKFGTVEHINLLRKPDGKLVGCAFIQFEKVNQAAKAILKASGKEYLGRQIFVDWAVRKDEFERKKREVERVEPKVEEVEAEIKSEVGSDVDHQSNKVQSNEAGDDASVKSESPSESSSESDSDVLDDGQFNEPKSEPDDSESEETNVHSKGDLDSKTKNAIPKVKIISNDVVEGRTIFIKNIPFDADENGLRKVCRKFGPLYYAIINRDRISGHSKGTGFVKFKTKESADLCLTSGAEMILDGTQLEVFPALSQGEIRQQTDAKANSDQHKDSRNLYLTREGIIMAGSKAANGVSASDMALRHKLEQIKNQVLKNLNRFISRNRLSIHNLPARYDDDDLRNMTITHTGFRPHECKIMRHQKITPEHPKGESKRFGFMSFTTHKEALAALRKLNNNPKVFGNTHRPIVAFSIEDRAVHRLKQKRDQKAKFNNPTYKQKLEKRKAEKGSKAKKVPTIPHDEDKQVLQNRLKQLEKSRQKDPSKIKVAEVMADFVGFEGKPGVLIKMRSNKKITEQAKEHKKKVNELKRKEKQKKQKLLHRLERKEIDRTKQRKKKVDKDDLSNLVNKYRKLIDEKANEALAEGKIRTRTKWYES